MKDQQQIESLFYKFLNGECTAEEIGELLSHFKISKDERALKALIQQHLELPDPQNLLPDAEERVSVAVDEVRAKLLQELEVTHQPILKLNKGWMAAAALLLITLSAGLFFYKGADPAPATSVVTRTSNEILPGGNKAVLTLADGTRIVLDDAVQGVLAKQGGISVRKTADGQLIYDVAAVDSVAIKPGYNTIETPRGGQYQVNLPDGSKVWLNAASVLKFPVNFVGSERRVQLSGEGYFEVAHNPRKPFHVAANQMDVEVLGTHFNVMAYPDELFATTTLLQGSVKVGSKGRHALLVPGQEATLRNAGGDFKIMPADVENAIAWKNGYFMFKSENIGSIMRKISRWYDVDVSYTADMSGQDFSGTISRTKNVSEILKMLELTGAVNLKIETGNEKGEGRRILVMP